MDLDVNIPRVGPYGDSAPESDGGELPSAPNIPLPKGVEGEQLRSQALVAPSGNFKKRNETAFGFEQLMFDYLDALEWPRANSRALMAELTYAFFTKEKETTLAFCPFVEGRFVWDGVWARSVRTACDLIQRDLVPVVRAAFKLVSDRQDYGRREFAQKFVNAIVTRRRVMSLLGECERFSPCGERREQRPILRTEP